MMRHSDVIAYAAARAGIGRRRRGAARRARARIRAAYWAPWGMLALFLVSLAAIVAVSIWGT